MSSQVTRRTFELEAGDKLVCDSDTGSLELVKVSGEHIDLNAELIDVTEGSRKMGMRMINPLTFMQLCGLLAASYGLAANTVSYRNNVYECAVVNPH